MDKSNPAIELDALKMKVKNDDKTIKKLRHFFIKNRGEIAVKSR